MCGWFRKDHVEPLVFTQSEVAAILDRRVDRVIDHGGDRVTVVRNDGQILSVRRDEWERNS